VIPGVGFLPPACSAACPGSWPRGREFGWPCRAVRAATAIRSRPMVAARAVARGRLARAPAARTRLCVMAAIDSQVHQQLPFSQVRGHLSRLTRPKTPKLTGESRLSGEGAAALITTRQAWRQKRRARLGAAQRPPADRPGTPQPSRRRGRTPRPCEFRATPRGRARLADRRGRRAGSARWRDHGPGLSRAWMRRAGTGALWT
jgi:hypothetical protein